MKKRVVVAMSGGVDSSTAAGLLLKDGFEVIGITMCFNLPDIQTGKPRCCGLQGIEDARRVAHALGIRHYVLNMQNLLQDKVIRNFCSEYMLGRTPNPCVRCNQFVKFGALLKKAKSLGAAYLATGHYAKIVRLADDKYALAKAVDLRKDQSYFLYRLNNEQLRRLLFPLGELTKDQVRSLARELKLPVAEKKESQEICFLPGDDYREFLKSACKKEIRPGNIVNKAGKILGAHSGVPFYTIGQREGLGIAAGFPLYVTGFNRRKNQIIAGPRQEALSRIFWVKQLTFGKAGRKNGIAASVKIRYNHKEAPAILNFLPGGLRIRFKQPQFAITPGQSAVIYKNDLVLGGGIITRIEG